LGGPLFRKVLHIQFLHCATRASTCFHSASQKRARWEPPSLRRKEETNFLLYPALIPQRAMRTSGTYWAKLSSRLTALHFGGSYGLVAPECNS